MDLKDIIRREADQIGLKLCGFAPLQALPHARFVRDWLRDGNAGTMSYVDRGLEKRLDPSLVAPGARSVIMVGLPYPSPRPSRIDWRRQLRGRIASYARGLDYHVTLLRRLEDLADRIRVHGVRAVHTYVDTGPVLEREWASLGGLGWFGKNTMILHQRQGSWFFLGEIFTDAELDPEPVVADHCGTCRRCLDLCPTGALREAYFLDARLCISYLTIEFRDVIPHALRSTIGEWVFGCDICQEVCPWNDKRDDAADRWGATSDELSPYLPELLAIDGPAYRHRYGTSAVSRAKRDCLARNAAVALGNTRNPEAVDSLAAALERDPSELVRAHAAWALGQVDDARARRFLGWAWSREPEESVRIEIGSSLDAPS